MRESGILRQRNTRRVQQYQMAKTMLVLVTVFLILNTPRLILGLLEVSQLNTVEICYEHGFSYNIPRNTYILDYFARLLVIINSSINFIIYCITGTEFRSRLYSWLHINSRQSWRKQLTQRRNNVAEVNTKFHCDEPTVTRITLDVHEENGVNSCENAVIETHL